MPTEAAEVPGSHDYGVLALGPPLGELALVSGPHYTNPLRSVTAHHSRGGRGHEAVLMAGSVLAPSPSGALSDDELAVLARAGERAALEVLLRRNFDRIHTICRRVTCHDEDAQDATQEALVAIYRNIGGFDHRAAFATWLYRVATNAALGEVRRRGRRPLPMDQVTSWGPDNRDLAGLEVPDRVDIDRALSQVPPVFRVAVILRDLCDLDYPTIAAVLDLPEGTVRSRIHRGRQALRALLSAEHAAA